MILDVIIILFVVFMFFVGRNRGFYHGLIALLAGLGALSLSLFLHSFFAIFLEGIFGSFALVNTISIITIFIITGEAIRRIGMHFSHYVHDLHEVDKVDKFLGGFLGIFTGFILSGAVVWALMFLPYSWGAYSFISSSFFGRILAGIFISIAR